MIDGITASEDDAGVSRNINSLFPKLLCWDCFQPYKRVKIKLYVVLTAQLEVGRLVALRSGLSNKDSFFAFRSRFINTVFYHVSAKSAAKLRSFRKKPNQHF